MVYSETTILIAVAAEVIGFHQCVKDTCELAAYFKSTGYIETIKKWKNEHYVLKVNCQIGKKK
jgi:hypothetical protein